VIFSQRSTLHWTTDAAVFSGLARTKNLPDVLPQLLATAETTRASLSIRRVEFPTIREAAMTRVFPLQQPGCDVIVHR